MRIMILVVLIATGCTHVFDGSKTNRILFDSSCTSLPQIDNLTTALQGAVADYAEAGINFDTAPNDFFNYSDPIIWIVCPDENNLGEYEVDGGPTTYTLGEYNYFTGEVSISRMFLNNYPVKSYITLLEHELFHAIKGVHVTDENAVMYPSIAAWGNTKVLGPTDYGQLCFLYPGIKACEPKYNIGSLWPDINLDE